MNAGTPAQRRLAIVLSHPTQYYSPWFRWLRETTALDFRVFYLWDFGVSEKTDPQFGTRFKWDVDLLSGYEHEFVPNKAGRPGAEHFFGFNNPGISARIAAWGPGAVLLFGYKWATHMRVVAWASRKGVPLIFRGDSHLLGRGRPAPHVRLALELLFSRFAAFLFTGEANRRYFKQFGISDRKLHFAPHSVDAGRFDPAEPVHRAAADALRARLGIGPGSKVVLFSGKFVADKQPCALAEAFLRLDAERTDLVLAGDGPEMGRLRQLAGGRERVHFLPFANQSEMPSRYLLADLFVLPSRGVYETWGLSVNEAMHMGVPCLVSDRVGCQLDLVTDGETGWVFGAEDPLGLERALARALGDLTSFPRCRQMRMAVGERIRGYTYVQTTNGLLAALQGLPPAAL